MADGRGKGGNPNMYRQKHQTHPYLKALTVVADRRETVRSEVYDTGRLGNINAFDHVWATNNGC